MEQSFVQGTGVVPGHAYAAVAWTRPAPTAPDDGREIPEEARAAEADLLAAAVETVAGRIEARAAAATGAAAEVLTATVGLVRDRGWRRAAGKLIAAGTPAPLATTRSIEQFCALLEKLGGLMAERTTDLRDIRNRVVAELLGAPEPGVPTPTSPVVLCAEDLAPADTAGLDATLVRALVTRLGGPTSHTAIIARQLGIPCVVAVTGLEQIPEGAMVLVDGMAGLIVVDPDPVEAAAKVEHDSALRAEIRSWTGPAVTADGQRVQLLANVADGKAAAKAAEGQAEGIGLFRTELCFLTAQSEPSVEEQARIYGDVLRAFPGRKVVVRTLDAGSEKPVPFANHENEENPALGVRGIRLGATNDGVLERQLDAVALAAQQQGATEPWVMAPMVATVDEAAEFAAACRARGLKPGIMVEVPAVALLAEQFLAEVEFFSIGTNDLTQYTMAADRMSSHLATLTDPWQPAVLRLIAMTADAGVRLGKPVGVCGEAAADPLLACLLVGLGVTSLSMAASAVPAVGVQLGKVTVAQCQEAARQVLAAPTARAAKELAAGLLE